MGGIGAAAVVPVVSLGDRAAAVPGAPIVVLRPPVRVFDSRTAGAPLGGKLVAGNSIAVAVGQVAEPTEVASAVFVNVTITDTEGRGHLVLRGSDLTGEDPLPSTSNVNWTTDAQTVANFALVPVGGENSLDVHAGGDGRTHVIIDVQGYISAVI
jgi:hypothetical protein